MNILCFGEPLIRFATVAHERLDEARTMEISYSGAESVVAVTLAQFGEQVSFASKLSSNRLGTNAIMNLARYGVDTSRITRSSHRMGLYYTERGRSIRPTVVTYDRSDTAMANAIREDFDWDRMLNGVEVFFFWCPPSRTRCTAPRLTASRPARAAASRWSWTSTTARPCGPATMP